jgi:hypothetical protein
MRQWIRDHGMSIVAWGVMAMVMTCVILLLVVLIEPRHAVRGGVDLILLAFIPVMWLFFYSLVKINAMYR